MYTRHEAESSLVFQYFIIYYKFKSLSLLGYIRTLTSKGMSQDDSSDIC